MVSATKVISPSKLAHVVLRTNNYEPMIEFYTTFLGGKVAHKAPVICFITYDEEHHRIALMNTPDIQDKVRQSNGLEHIAFTFDSFAELTNSYRQRKALGMEPVWCVNHGVTTSIYYKDPDGNILETQVDNFTTDEECNAYMESAAFQENPIGVDFDPEELARRVDSGESVESLIKRPNIGARPVETVPKAYMT